MKRTFLYCIVIFVIGWWGVKALFGGTFYTSHDGYTHTARIAQYAIALRDGQFPPRWAGTLNSGFGSPIFVFSYPLPYILGSTLHFLGFSLTDSFKILIAGSFLLSGLVMFYFLKEFFDVKSAFMGSIFYLLAPYRFLNIYVRGSLSESIAFAAIPLVFFTLVKIWKTNKPAWKIIGTIALSLLLLAQNLVAAMFLPLIIGFIAVLFLTARSWSFLKHIFITFLLGFGIAAFAYTPVFFEKKYLRFAELITYYQSHFVSLFQLIRSPWGYGFSLPGTIHDEMSFQIGLIHLLLFFFGILIFIYRLLRKKWDLPNSLFIYSMLFFVVAVILMIDTEVTKYIWQTVPFLKTIDLPWRFLGITVFTLSIVAAYVISNIRSTILLMTFLLLVIYANRNHIRVNQYLYYPNEEFMLYKGTATWLNEYTPIWRNSTSFAEFEGRVDILTGDIEILEEFVSKSNHFKVVINAKTDGIVRLNIFYFPGWSVFLDNKQVTQGSGYYVTTGQDVTIGNEDGSGLISVPVVAGIHTVEVVLRESLIRYVGDGISVISLTIVFVWSILVIKRRKQR